MNKETLNNLNSLVGKMRKENELISLKEQITRIKTKTIIVEGPNDKAALQSFGVKNVFVLSKKPLFAVAEEIAEHCSKNRKECIILTDLDREGKELYGKLKKNLTRLGINVDDSFREFLFKETKLRQIEGLHRYYERLKQ